MRGKNLEDQWINIYSSILLFSHWWNRTGHWNRFIYLIKKVLQRPSETLSELPSASDGERTVIFFVINKWEQTFFRTHCSGFEVQSKRIYIFKNILLYIRNIYLFYTNLHKWAVKGCYEPDKAIGGSVTRSPASQSGSWKKQQYNFLFLQKWREARLLGPTSYF